jgi:hypothetical protein
MTMWNEETELDFDRVKQEPVMTAEEKQRVKIQARICRKLIIDSNPGIREIVERLSDSDVLELNQGRLDQLMLQTFQTEPTQATTEHDGIIRECLDQHEETAPKPMAETTKKSVPSVLLDEKSIEIHTAATEFLKHLLKEDPQRFLFL